MQSTIRPISFIMLAEMLERFAYYGTRAILVLFLTKYAGWDNMKAVEIYGFFTGLVYFSSVIGGVLSDVTKRPALLALIGNSLSTASIFLLAVSSSDALIHAALLLLAIGSGIYKPAIVCTLFRVSTPVKHRFDFISGLFYLLINIGAFMAPVVIGGLGDTGNPDDFKTGFLVAGAASAIVTTLLAINYNNFQINNIVYDTQRYTLTPAMAGQIAVFFIVSIVFWLGYELYPHFAAGVLMNSQAQIIATISTMLFAFILIPLSLIRNFRGALKVAIGLGLVTITLGVLPYSGLPSISGVVILGAAEILVAPILMSQILLNGSPRFAGTLISLFMFLSMITNKLAGMLAEPETGAHFPVLLMVALGCAFLGGALLLLNHFRKKEELNSAQQLF